MLKIKKRMLQALALFFSMFFIIAPLFQNFQVYANPVCGDQTTAGNPTFCSIGIKSEPRVNFPCPFPSACYEGNNPAPAECSWSVSADGRPTYCWSFTETDSAAPLINNSTLNFRCENRGSTTDCGGILAQMGIQLGGTAINNQEVNPNTLPGGIQIGVGGNPNLRYRCVSMDYNQSTIAQFMRGQAARSCQQAALGAMGTIGTAGLIISGGQLLAAGTGAISALTGTVIISAATIPGLAVGGAEVIGLRNCLAALNAPLLDWSGEVKAPGGALACSARTTLTLNSSFNVTANSTSSAGIATSPFSLCNQIPDPSLKSQCVACGSRDGGDEAYPKALWTAVGCIPTTSTGIVGAVMKLGLGIAGTAALLMFLAGSFMLSTSQADTKRVGEAKELLTSAVIGLLFIIFSVTLLQFIGVTIFRIPGFGP